jgi:uncharacterized protein (TIRG00374 family)
LYGRTIETLQKSTDDPVDIDATEPRPKKRQRIIGWVKFFLAILILFMLVLWIQWEDLIQSLLLAHAGLLVLAVLLLVPNLLFQGLRWGYLLRRQTPGVPLKEIVASLFLGWTLGILTPGRVGQFARAFAVPSAPTLPTIGLTIVDKLFTLVWIVLLGAVGFFSFFAIEPAWTWLWFPVFAVILWLAFSPRQLDRILQKLCHRLPFREKLSEIISTLQTLRTRDCLVAHIFSLLTVITFLSQFVILISAFVPINYINGMRAATAVTFVKTALPITFGELGVGEAASIHFFGQFGVPKAAAFNASIIGFFINLVIPSVVGLAFLPSLKLSRKKNTEA